MNFKPLIFILIQVILVVNFSCTNQSDEFVNDSNSANEPYQINLRWNKAYSNETQPMAETGLLWALSFLGAELPKGSFNQGVVWNNNSLTVNFKKLGFSQQALDALAKLIAQFKSSEEYKTKGAIDLGRFVALSLNSSHHYYAITGIAPTFSLFKQGKIFDVKQFASTNSTISLVDRIIDLPDTTLTNYKQMAYVANECEGRIKNGGSKVAYIEVKEQMANSQFRFAIYDTLGQLLTASNGPAGKPAKCLWCHESNIQPLFAEQVDEPGYYGAAMFKHIIQKNITLLNAYRNQLNTDVDFEKKQDHAFVELLYITFMEPGAERLALEWGKSVEEVKATLANLPLHNHAEFTFLVNLYDRRDVDALSPYKSLQAPSSAREKSVYEPNLIK